MALRGKCTSRMILTKQMERAVIRSPFKFAAALAVALLRVVPAVSPALADDLNPVGRWQSTTGEARYEVVNCGNGQLCARLTWLRSDARTAENLQYLNQYVVSGAVPASDNKWRGTVNYEGETINGNLTMLNGDRMRVSGCKVIMCQTIEFTRI